MALEVKTPTLKKQVAASAANTGAIVYVVPNGKTFVGHIMVNGGQQAQVNGAAIPSTTNTTVVLPVTLLAGTVVKCGATATTVVGVEQ